MKCLMQKENSIKNKTKKNNTNMLVTYKQYALI